MLMLNIDLHFKFIYNLKIYDCGIPNSLSNHVFTLLASFLNHK